MDLTEKTVKKNVIYCGKIVNLRVDDALLPDGRPCMREVVEHPGGAAVLYAEAEKVLLVRQFRYAYGEELWEIPAGKLEKGEDPRLAAARELEEETGQSAGRLELWFVLYPTPGYTNEKIYIYRAYGAHAGHVHPDEDEFLSVSRMPFGELADRVLSGRVEDAKTVAAVLKAKALLKL